MKVFRPFWSYDIRKTEEWLSAMAEKGFYYVEINRWTRYFVFQKGKPKSITYRIFYDKIKTESLSRSLLDSGWVKVSQSGNWNIISNEKPSNQITTASVREGIIKHNKILMYIFNAILIYLATVFTFNLSILGLDLFQDGQVEIVESPMWMLTYILLAAAIALFFLAIYSVIKINKTNKFLINEKHNKLQDENLIEGRLSKEKERQLKHAGQLVVKTKYAWMYAPDKLEKWLEAMEESGFNLYRVNKFGTVFYFIKGRSRQVSYCADYQNIADESYSDIHIDAGWKCVFKSNSSFQKWMIWSHEYLKGEERPQIYSDKSNRLKHAKRVAITYTILFLPLTFMYLFILGLNISDMFNNDVKNLNLFNASMQLFVLLIFGSFTVRIWLYYMRLRKQYEFQ